MEIAAGAGEEQTEDNRRRHQEKALPCGRVKDASLGGGIVQQHNAQLVKSLFRTIRTID